MISRFRNTRSDRYRVPTSTGEGPHSSDRAFSEQQLNSGSTGSMAQLHPPHIAEAQVIGVSERHLDPKRFVFRVDLTWSDGHKTTSFRSYSEFFDLQCELLSQFPQEAGEQKNSQRTLPYLPGKQIFRRSSRHLAEERLPKINNYITELLKLPENISQCERVLRFFRSNWQEDRIRCDEGHGALSRENSTTSIKYTVKQLSNSRHPLNYSSSTEELLEGIDEQPSSSASSERIFAINGEQESITSDDDQA